MIYYVTGNNLFGQWYKNNKIFCEFTKIPTSEQSECFLSGENTQLLSINWAFNVYKRGKQNYVVGAWKGNDNQCKLLPAQEVNNDDIVTANDFYIFIIKSAVKLIHCYNLETEEIKIINLNLEHPDKEDALSKKDDYITRAVVFNESALYLTSHGALYSGLLPNYVDTSHCIGKVTDVQCGYEHYVLLTDTGSVYTWGNGRRLQLGHGEVNNEEVPTLVEALSGIKIKQIAAGGWHSLALSEYGDVYAWGWNDTGQLGIFEKGTETNSYSIPTLVDLYINGNVYECSVIDIACGSKHSAVLLDDHSVWTSGSNKYGQLGNGAKESSSYFQKSFQCNKKSKLVCGLWTTVITSE